MGEAMIEYESMLATIGAILAICGLVSMATIIGCMIVGAGKDEDETEDKMKDPVIAERDRLYAEEEREMARRDEVERQEEKAEQSMRIKYISRFVNGKELHYAEIIDEDGEEIWACDDNDSLEDVIVIARSRRDKFAHEMAENAVKDAEQNQ